MTEQIDLPAPNTYPSGEKEWVFATQDEDGYVNVEDGALVFNLARYDEQLDGMPTFAEGSMTREFAEQFALAVLAALNETREG